MCRFLLHVQELTTSHDCKKESGSVGSMLGWPHHLLGWWHGTSQCTDSSSSNPPGRITFLLFFLSVQRGSTVTKVTKNKIKKKIKIHVFGFNFYTCEGQNTIFCAANVLWCFIAHNTLYPLQVKPVFKKGLIPRESDYLHFQIVSQKIAKL